MANSQKWKKATELVIPTLSAVDTVVGSTVTLHRLWHSDVGTGANSSIIFS